MKRSPLIARPWRVGAFSSVRPVSQRRRRSQKARQLTTAEVIERDQACQWPVMVEAYLLAHPEDRRIFDRVPKCGGRLVQHEPKHSRNVGRLNVAQSIASCWVHNWWCETSPLGALIGFVQKGNGEPIRKGAVSC